MSVYEARGFPRCIRCIDCQHYKWKTVPVTWAGNFTGKEKKRTIVFEGIADKEHCIKNYFSDVLVR